MDKRLVKKHGDKPLVKKLKGNYKIKRRKLEKS